MKKRTHSLWTVGVFSLTLIFAASHTLTVRADDDTPPVPAESSEETEQALPLQTETPLLEQVPENTLLAVTGPEGEIIPLAAQQAAEIIAHGDPIWCPEGAAPQAGVGGCTDPGPSNVNYDPTSLASLLAYLAANQPTQHGVIWIESTYDSSVNDPSATGFVIDGASLTTWRNYNLTIQGGWNGVPGSMGINGISLFSGDHLHIINWQANVAVNEIAVDGSAGSSDGIRITTSGSIALDNVSAQNSGAIGAFLDNTSGTADVVITGTNTFNSNASGGLQINSRGTISTNNVTANNNGGTGAGLFNQGGSGNVVMSGTNVFNSNTRGLDIRSAGAVTLENITANNNAATNGLYLDNKFGSNRPVTLNGVNQFTGNRGTNLAVFSRGPITLNNITASGSLFGDGAYIDNMGAADGTPIVIAGVNAFNNNRLNGLFIAAEGPITLQQTTAAQNIFTGATLVNMAGSGNMLVERGLFSQNGFQGVYIAANGDVEVNCSVFLNNSSYGLQAGLSGAAALNGNVFSGNAAGDYSITGSFTVNDSYPCSGPGGGGGTSIPRKSVNCSVSSSFKLLLPNNNSMTFFCPVKGKPTLANAIENLPGPMPAGVNVHSALDGRINGVPSAVQPGRILVSFVIPQGANSSNLAILYWNGVEWVDLSQTAFRDGRIVIEPPRETDEGFFETLVNFTGVFALVSK